jgi:hypothetical protein
MMRYPFQAWLERQPLQPKAVRDYVAECARVDRYHGDLDRHFDADRMKGLLVRLTPGAYRLLLPGDGMPIRGDIEHNLATYRSAVRKYCSFRAEHADR